MSGYHLYTSSNLKFFPGEYPNVFLPENPLAAPVYIIVQNAGLGTWLTRYLAEKQGGIMGPRILMPEQAIRQFITDFPSIRELPSPEFLFPDGMKLVLCKAMEELMESDGETWMSPIRSYLEQDRTGRLWPLASSLANIFHHYAMNCPALIDAWDSGNTCSQISGNDKSSELWQMKLWNRMFHDNAPYLHLSQALALIDRKNDIYDGESARIVLFGSTFLGERGLDFFKRMAKTLEVHHFVLSPGPAIKEPSTPYLINNAKLAIGFSAVELAPISRQETWENPGLPDRLLQRLRSSLIEDRPFDGIVMDDGSLHFHDISNARRCIEVLKDRILTALVEDKSLAPTQIGVLAPDISLYAPYIEAIFPSHDADGTRLPDHLPFNVTDLPERNETPFLAAFEGLLNLPGSRFGRHDILQLLENPCFVPVGRDPLLPMEWREFVDFLNIRWGVNAEQREQAGTVDVKTGSWENGFERILTGYFHDEGDNTHILPFPNLSDNLASSAGKLMQLINDLNEHIRPLDGRTMELAQWVVLWERIVDNWIKTRHDTESDDEFDRQRIKNAFRDLLALADDLDGLSDYNDRLLSWTVFRSLLEEQLDNANRQRGRYLANGITCGSLKPTRAIPFRRIYVLGLDEGLWPGRERLTGFDLRDKVARTIDLSRESIARFALLEVIYSAEEHLSLFYTGRSPDRAEPLAPAAPVLDIIDHLGGQNAVGPITLRHSLLPWTAEVLTGTGPLATTSPLALKLSEELEKQWNPFTIPPFPSLPLLDSKEETVHWLELVSFLKNPVKYFYSRIMGISLPLAEPDNSEHDILEIPALDWYRWKAESIEGNITALEHPDDFINTFHYRKTLENAVCSTRIIGLQTSLWKNETLALAEQLARIVREGFSPSPPCALHLESGPERSYCPDPAEPETRILRFPAPGITLPDQTPIKLIGVIGGLRPLFNEGKPNLETWTMLDFISPKTLTASHNLRSWTAALLIAATVPNLKEIRVFRIGSRDFKARRYFFQEEDFNAAASGEKILLLKPEHILKNLVLTWHKGSKYPLPLYPELANAMNKELEKNSCIDFETLARIKWESIINDAFTPFSTMQNCQWRQQFLPEPDLGGENFHDAFYNIYKTGGLL